jgi:hypothetical protein
MLAYEIVVDFVEGHDERSLELTEVVHGSDWARSKSVFLDPALDQTN